MSTSINIKGYVGNHPEFIEFPSGATVVKFPVAVKNFKKGANSETIWFDVQAWNELGDPIMDCVQKGFFIDLNGWLTMNKYTNKKGEQVTKPVINMHRFMLNADDETVQYLRETQDEAHRIALNRTLKK